MDVGESAESTNHQTRADEQNQSQSDLNDDQHAAQAVLLAALAIGTATFANAGAEADSGVFENGNGAEERAGEDRNGKGEE